MRRGANAVIGAAIVMMATGAGVPGAVAAELRPAGLKAPDPPEISASVEIPAGYPVPVIPSGGAQRHGDGGGAGNGGGPQAYALNRGCDPWSVVSRYSDTSYMQRGDEIGQAIATSPVGSMTLFVRLCHGMLEFFYAPDGTNVQPPPPTVDDLMPGTYDRAVAQIPLPEPALSPPVEVGSLVNFGVWLAVADPEPVTARAEVGAVWAQATAMLRLTTFDMGNGDVVECDGAGDPLTPDSPLWDTDEQSPLCGYTFEWPSAPQFTGTGDLAYHLTVTTHWEVRETGLMGATRRSTRSTCLSSSPIRCVRCRRWVRHDAPPAPGRIDFAGGRGDTGSPAAALADRSGLQMRPQRPMRLLAGALLLRRGGGRRVGLVLLVG